MNEIYELNFHGNRQEIENEKQRKRELMSHFPKMLGTVDETRYVLHDDEKQKQTDYFESKPVSPLTVAPAKDEPLFNIRGIGEQQSEKPKKDVSMQTALHGIANFGNKENPLGFGNWKSASTLFGPQKEKNETKAPRSPFDFDGNTAKEENIPFNHGIQFPGLGAVGGNQPRTRTVRNDSLGLEKDKVENVADSLKTVNVNNNTNTVSNNTVTTKPYIKPGLYGKNPDRDFTNDLRKIKQELPPIAASILNNSGTEIVVLDNMFSVDENGVVTPRIGRYYASKNKIYLDSWHVDKRTLLSEAIHAVQDYLGMTGTGKSNLEFQEHVIKDLYYHHKYRKTKDIEYLKGYTTNEDKVYTDFVNEVLDEKGVLDLNKFLSEIDYFIGKFQDYYKQSNSYQAPAVKNFNYNWIKLLHIFGIEYKY